LTWGGEIARAWNAASGAPLGPPLRHEGLSGAEFDASGVRVLTWGGGAARTWSLRDGAQIGPLRHEGLDAAHFSADGARIRTMSGRGDSGRLSRGVVRLWDTATGAPIGPGITDVCSVVSEDANRIASCSGGTVQLWDAASGAPVGPALRHEGVTAAFVSADGARVVTWSDEGVVSAARVARLWNGATGRRIGTDHVFEGRSISSGNDFAARFSADGRRVLTWGHGRALLLDAATGTRIGGVGQHGEDGLGWGARFSEDEARILTWGGDHQSGSVRFWSASTGAPLGPVLQHDGAVMDASLSGDGARLMAWGWSGNVRLFDVTWARPRASLADLRREACASFPSSAEIVLLGQATAAGPFHFPWSTRPLRSSIRRIDARDAEIVPLLRGREGEDVCE
jgi:WD40 repeat protein